MPTITASGFLTPLIADADDLPYVLWLPLVYDSVRLQERVTVPIGFCTDLASIPQLVQNVVPKEGKYNAPAVIHDFLYGYGAVNGKPISWSDADAVLLEAMIARGVGVGRRETIYRGVRAGGWWAWFKYRHGMLAPKIVEVDSLA
jgi:hypothetical protein